MSKQDKLFGKSARPWQLRWWTENPERWRWAGTIAVIFALMGIFAYQNPEVWQVAEREEEEGSVLVAELDPPPVIGDPLIDVPEPEDYDPYDDDAAGLADVDPALLEAEPEEEEVVLLEEIVSVSAAPQSWLAPGTGNWSRSYGYGQDPTLGDYRFHGGADMTLAGGSPVYAAAEGRVLLAEEDSYWGGVIIIEHGGNWRTTYKALKPTVQAGTEVAAGDQIGTVLESSPVAEASQPAHLHFEMELEGVLQNPADWLR